MTKVVFHLGDHKTGSTAIQSTLATGSFTCDTVSLLYPQAHRVSHIILAKSLIEKGITPQRAARFEEVRDEIAAKSPDVAVISAEHFEGVNPIVLQQAIKTHMPQYLEDARFIAYVRPHAERLMSSFSEVSKIGSSVGTYEQFHERTLINQRFTYTERFLKWRSVFGDKFELRPLIRDRLYNRDVVADFLHYALDGAPFQINSAPMTNESLSLEDLLVVRQFHSKLGHLNGKTTNGLQMLLGLTLGRRMAETPGAKSTKMQMSRALADRVVADYAEDAAALDAAFFTGTPMSDALKAAPSMAVEVEQSLRIKDHFTAPELRQIEIWASLVSDMVRVVPDQWAAKFREANRATVTKTTAAEGKKRPGGKRIGAGPNAGKGRVAGQGRAAGKRKGPKVAVPAEE